MSARHHQGRAGSPGLKRRVTQIMFVNHRNGGGKIIFALQPQPGVATHGARGHVRQRMHGHVLHNKGVMLCKEEHLPWHCFWKSGSVAPEQVIRHACIPTPTPLPLLNCNASLPQLDMGCDAQPTQSPREPSLRPPGDLSHGFAVTTAIRHLWLITPKARPPLAHHAKRQARSAAPSQL